MSEGWKGAGGEVRNGAGGGAGQWSRRVAKVAYGEGKGAAGLEEEAGK